MKKQNIKYFIIGGSVLASAGIITAILLGRSQRKKEIQLLLSNISQGAGQFGDLRDFGIQGKSFDPLLWQKNPACVSIGDWEAAGKVAKKIYKSLDIAGWIPVVGSPFFVSDKEEAVIGEFKKMKNECDVSIVSDAFFEKYKIDLTGFLSRHINQGDNAAILKQTIEGLEPATKTYSDSPLVGQGLKPAGGSAREWADRVRAGR